MIFITLQENIMQSDLQQNEENSYSGIQDLISNLYHEKQTYQTFSKKSLSEKMSDIAILLGALNTRIKTNESGKHKTFEEYNQYVSDLKHTNEAVLNKLFLNLLLHMKKVPYEELEREANILYVAIYSTKLSECTQNPEKFKKLSIDDKINVINLLATLPKGETLSKTPLIKKPSNDRLSELQKMKDEPLEGLFKFVVGVEKKQNPSFASDIKALKQQALGAFCKKSPILNVANQETSNKETKTQSFNPSMMESDSNNTSALSGQSASQTQQRTPYNPTNYTAR